MQLSFDMSSDPFGHDIAEASHPWSQLECIWLEGIRLHGQDELSRRQTDVTTRETDGERATKKTPQCMEI